jgi:AcrR family transcriptional regulator
VARLADPLLADRRRRQILDAAMGCFQRRGFHQATMQEICAEANISAGALYRYFSSKAEIIAAIADEKRGEADAVFLSTVEQQGLIDGLVMIARDFFEKMHDGHGALVADIISEALRDESIARTLGENDRRTVELIVTALKTAQAKREIDATLDPEMTAETLCAIIEGIGLRRAFLRDTDPDAAIAQFRSLAERYLSLPQ